MAQVVRFWPKIRRLDQSDSQIENGIGLLSSKNLAEQSRPGTAAARGTHKSTSTSSDRCVGLRIQPRCANTVAAPHRSQTTASCRSTRARTWRTRSAAHPARVFRGYVLCESTHRAAALVLGSDSLLKKTPREAPRLRGQTRV